MKNCNTSRYEHGKQSSFSVTLDLMMLIVKSAKEREEGKDGGKRERKVFSSRAKKKVKNRSEMKAEN